MTELTSEVRATDRRRRSRIPLWIGAIAAVSLAPLAARVVAKPNFRNGGFEDGMAGWNVSERLQIVKDDPVRPASKGSTAILFNRNDQSTDGQTVSQTFATTPGQRYGLHFDYGAVGAVADQVMRVTVTGDGVILDQTVRIAPLSADPFYVPQAFSFIANSSSATLTFTDRSNDYVIIDGLLDNVEVAAEASDLPTISTSPSSTAVALGHDVMLQVKVSGVGPFSYQWRFNGKEIPGASEDRYGIKAATLNQAGNYAVAITNRSGSVTSSAATVTVVPNDILLNGGFEYGSAGWSLIGPEDSVAVSTNPRYTFTDGDHLVHFNFGQRPPRGSLSQTFTTVPGAHYVMNFDVGAFSLLNRDEQRMHVSVRGNTEVAALDVTVYAPGTGGRYIPQTLKFVADSASTNVTFQDTSRTTMNVDVLLDHVRVIDLDAPAAPQPACGPAS
jgi:Immunoglobulin domain/Protein of unknown function (DUF642)